MKNGSQEKISRRRGGRNIFRCGTMSFLFFIVFSCTTKQDLKPTVDKIAKPSFKDTQLSDTTEIYSNILNKVNTVCKIAGINPKDSTFRIFHQQRAYNDTDTSYYYTCTVHSSDDVSFDCNIVFSNEIKIVFFGNPDVGKSLGKYMRTGIGNDTYKSDLKTRNAIISKIESLKPYLCTPLYGKPSIQKLTNGLFLISYLTVDENDINLTSYLDPFVSFILDEKCIIIFMFFGA